MIKGAFDGKTLTLELTADHAAAIIQAIGVAGVFDQEYMVPGFEMEFDYLTEVQRAILLAIPTLDLAESMAQRHADHPGEDLVALREVYEIGFIDLARNLNIGPTLNIIQ